MNNLTQKNLLLDKPQPADQNPAAVYLASLPSDTGKRTQAHAIRVIARTLGADMNSLNWGALRHQHTAAIRAKVAKTYSPATANKILSALRQALKQAWLLGQMPAEEYTKAIKLEPVTGGTRRAGRELSQFGYPLVCGGNARAISTPEQAYWRARGKAVRLLMTGYWADNWYKLSLRARAAASPIFAAGRTPGRTLERHT